MNTTSRRILFLILVIALLAISTTVVFAKELGLLTISGPGIKGEVTLKDPDALMGLETSGFFDQTASIKPPEDLGEGYAITAQLNLDGKMVPYVQMVYYPTTEGEPGYVHYTARLTGEKLQSKDRWQVLSRSGDQGIRKLMAASGIAVQSALVKAPEAAAPAKEAVSAPAAEPAVIPQVPAAAPQRPNLAIPLIVGLLGLAGLAMALRRRTAGTPT